MTTQPDVEIYVKDVIAADILDWLRHYFEIPEPTLITQDAFGHSPFSIELSYKDTVLELRVTPKAAGKAYTSLWFKSQHTPWQSDLECANSLLEKSDTEIRCSAESWGESEAEHSEKWWKLTRGSKELIAWG